MDDPTIKELIERIDRLEKENEKLSKENAELRKRVAKLEKRLMQYEGPNNPSSAKSVYKKRSKSDKKSSSKSRKKALKRKGRKKGHKGSTLVLESSNEIHDYVSHCTNYQEAVELEVQRHIYSYQTVDLPERISVDITTYHVYEAQCLGCDEFTSSDKQTLQGTIFGPKLSASSLCCSTRAEYVCEAYLPYSQT